MQEIQEVVDAAVRMACATYRPRTADPGYWRDEERGRFVFHVYVDLRADASTYVGQTGGSVEARRKDHCRRDGQPHVCTLATITVRSRGDALGLEAEVAVWLRRLGVQARTAYAA